MKRNTQILIEFRNVYLHNYQAQEAQDTFWKICQIVSKSFRTLRQYSRVLRVLTKAISELGILPGPLSTQYNTSNIDKNQCASHNLHINIKALAGE